MFSGYGSRLFSRRPVGWPMQSTSGFSIAVIIRLVIFFSSLLNEVWIEAITQSSASSRSSG